MSRTYHARKPSRRGRFNVHRIQRREVAEGRVRLRDLRAAAHAEAHRVEPPHPLEAYFDGVSLAMA